jgi:hypothetical protein
MKPFEHYVHNIPVKIGEKETDRYLRAFAAMIERLDEDSAGECSIDQTLEAARSAVAFIADDAFRQGFETCHANVVGPLRESTISRADAMAAVVAHGLKIHRAIAAYFEDPPGGPTNISVEIDELELPPARLEIPQ